MTTRWAILIGINRYEDYQPLLQAHNDALEMQQYLIQEAGFAAENCLLFSDLQAPAQADSAHPSKAAILETLERLCQTQLGPGDLLWVFFSGYGAQVEEQDYLLPVEGKADQIAATAIAVSDVIQQLQQAHTDNLLLLLDMNRSQSALAGQTVGSQALQLATQARIPLILSCQPEQFSHETLAVRHGLFTAALLEGLRYEGTATLEQLSQYLQERLPELCEHHWRPEQNPAAVIPTEQGFRLLPPQPLQETVADRSSEETEFDPVPDEALVAPIAVDDGAADDDGGETPEAAPGAIILHPAPTPDRQRLGWLWQLVGLLGVGALLAAVLLRNRPMVQQVVQEVMPAGDIAATADEEQTDEPDAAAPEEPQEPEEPVADSPVPGPVSERLQEARQAIRPGQASPFATAIATASQIPPSDPSYPTAQADIQRWIQVILDLAKSRAAAGELEAAIGAAQLVPQTPADTHQEAQELISGWQQRLQVREQIRAAQAIPRAGQASTYQRGIIALRQVSPDYPAEYTTAQNLADDWSEKMLTIARARAAQGRYDTAVQAARLIPEETKAYPQAQTEIQRWQAR